MSSLSVLCATRDPGPRVRAALEPLRPVADEILVAVDSRAGVSELGDYAAIADRVLRYERGQTHSALAWLHAQCRGDWVLVLAGDEVPGTELVAALPELVSRRDALQYSFTLRWLWPDPAQWLAGAPWHPDFHARLVRNDGTLRFLGRKHELARPVLPHRFCDLPLWHLNLLVLEEEERRAKVERNVGERAGLVAEGGAELNTAFYLPEDSESPLLETVPEPDAIEIRRVLEAKTAGAAPPADVPLATRAEIEPLWAGRELEPEAFAATIEPLSAAPLRLAPGEQCTIYVRVRNEGDERWPWGLDHPPLFRLGFRWHPDGIEGRAGFPCDVPPGEERIVPVALAAPEIPGSYRLELSVLLEGVRWFGEPCLLEVRVGG